jgi:16S rRNA (guanine(966)-N(2))-methyltransferase RsmD
VPGGARPTSGRARAALFDVLGPGRISGARVLDLFAGSGAVGLEAVSRGAASAVLVESDSAALARTCVRLGASPEQVRVLSSEAGSALATLLRAGDRFDLVFADPPYASDPRRILDGAARLLAQGGVLVVQADEGADVRPPPSLEPVSRRAYGRNVFHFFGIPESRL